MTLAGFSFIFWRMLEIVTLIPTLGMLAWFVHAYTSSNVLTPDFILVLFITSVLACAWAIATLFLYARARHSGFFVALVDLAFVGCFIAGVYLLRGIAGADCVNFTAGGFYFDLGILGYVGRNSNNPWSIHANKTCAMLKASFAFGIMNCIFFFITFLLALMVGRHYSRKDRVVVEKRRYSHSHHSRHHSRSPRRSSHHHHSPRRHGFV